MGLRPINSRAAGTLDRRRLLVAGLKIMEREIDWLVYELYGLTEAEIAIVENTAKT